MNINVDEMAQQPTFGLKTIPDSMRIEPDALGKYAAHVEICTYDGDGLRQVMVLSFSCNEKDKFSETLDSKLSGPDYLRFLADLYDAQGIGAPNT
jgi:hypothetical protein